MAQSVDRGGGVAGSRRAAAHPRRGDREDDPRRDRAGTIAGAGMGAEPRALTEKSKTIPCTVADDHRGGASRLRRNGDFSRYLRTLARPAAEPVRVPGL